MVKKTAKKVVKKKATPKKAASKKTAGKKAAKKSGVTKRAKTSATKSASAKKAVALKKPHVTKSAAKTARKAASKQPVKQRRISTRGLSEVDDSVDFQPQGLGARSGGQSGGLQGLSDLAGADSESVDELVEEGNAFEAGIIKGVQDVPDADEGEIVTHEVLEDDVPREYDEE